VSDNSNSIESPQLDNSPSPQLDKSPPPQQMEDNSQLGNSIIQINRIDETGYYKSPHNLIDKYGFSLTNNAIPLKSTYFCLVCLKKCNSNPYTHTQAHLSFFNQFCEEKKSEIYNNNFSDFFPSFPLKCKDIVNNFPYNIINIDPVNSLYSCNYCAVSYPKKKQLLKHFSSYCSYPVELPDTEDESSGYESSDDNIRAGLIEVSSDSESGKNNGQSCEKEQKIPYSLSSIRSELIPFTVNSPWGVDEYYERDGSGNNNYASKWCYLYEENCQNNEQINNNQQDNKSSPDKEDMGAKRDGRNFDNHESGLIDQSCHNFIHFNQMVNNYGTRCQSYKQRYSPFEDKDNLFYSTVHRERNRDYKGVAEEIQ
jgi:hypothetical protein